MQRRDHLERAVLEELWRHPDGLSAAELVEQLPGRRLALTTVHTVLDRLRAKGLVERERQDGVYRHRAARSRDELAAEAMLEVLRDAGDHTLALSRFVDGVSPDDARTLQQVLRRVLRRP